MPARASVFVVLGCVLAIAARPHLWPIAIRRYMAVVRRRWWMRPPFLPLPARGYVEFRLTTAYGSVGRASPDDLVSYLEWCRTQPRA